MSAEPESEAARLAYIFCTLRGQLLNHDKRRPVYAQISRPVCKAFAAKGLNPAALVDVLEEHPSERAFVLLRLLP